ncbi:oxygen-insensitive NADPH nitroreductase [Bacillus tianshenii]|nr:oxygen-insensitive NADPH nitroreductase [Bacillus tianshenii]
MNQTINTIQSHRSVRKFKDERLTSEQVETIVRSAQSAATSSYIQSYSIIGVTDQQKKDALAQLAGNQPYVAKSGHLFVFCADLYRHEQIAQWKGEQIDESLESTELFMVALIDAALAAQNAVLAAESMGLGACYIGGIRNDLDGVQQILETPKRVIPLFGLTVGTPDHDPDLKPRLPLELIYHENTYNTDLERMKDQLSTYDRVIKEYYKERTDGKREDSWTDLIMTLLSNNKRKYMKEFIEKQGFNLR